MDLSPEITFKTARSGGKGGQHVNKVETMVEGYWNLEQSALVSPEQKEMLRSKLENRITAAGFLLVKSQTERSQLGNKEEVIRKINTLVQKALIQPRKRKKTALPRAARERRLLSKKRAGEIKQGRVKIKPGP